MMCKKCVGVEVIGKDGTCIHIGYSDHKTWYEKLVHGDIILSSDEDRRFSQMKFFELWDTLEKQGYGNIPGPGYSGDEMGCYKCDRGLMCLPSIDATCPGCGEVKSDKIKEIWENRDLIEEEMKIFEEEYGEFGPGKEAKPVEIALRVGLICPEGHWICSDCLLLADST